LSSPHGGAFRKTPIRDFPWEVKGEGRVKKKKKDGTYHRRNVSGENGTGKLRKIEQKSALGRKKRDRKKKGGIGNV